MSNLVRQSPNRQSINSDIDYSSALSQAGDSGLLGDTNVVSASGEAQSVAGMLETPQEQGPGPSGNTATSTPSMGTSGGSYGY